MQYFAEKGAGFSYAQTLKRTKQALWQTRKGKE